MKEIITTNREQKARYKCKVDSGERVIEKINQQMEEIKQKFRHEEVVSINQIKDMRE